AREQHTPRVEDRDDGCRAQGEPVGEGVEERLAGSPALAAGAVIENNGGKDYFGDRLKPGAPNIGAYAGRGVR
ncbi:hypothetical protein, partial [Streptomyces sp. NPDC048669]|uniref:hypothetical protein n=1 Tax=Streptomyces sp. NPDC048669 TaxID=3155267 RepID=UPI0034156481